jgi:sterol desaturase/sphingolipid hydroxylase (fatty acid hydroxylase superfamily)
MFGEFLRDHIVNLAFYGGVVALFAVVERLRPVEKQSVRALAFNVSLFSLLYLALSYYYYEMAGLHRYVADFRQVRFGFSNFVGRDLSAIGFVGRFMLFILAADFIKYWMHRAMHRVPLFWRFHRAHHSDRHFNASTNLREQWAGAIYGDAVFAIISAPLFGVLSLPVPLTAAYITYGFFAHANLRLSLGWLTPVIVGPHYHRIHHSRLPEHAYVNYASFFPLFDILFGTYYAPATNEFPPTGLVGEQHNSLWGIQLLPFRPASPPVRVPPSAATAFPAE